MRSARVLTPLLLVALAACGASGNRVVGVKGNRAWTDTEVDLALGQAITLQAAGSLTSGPGLVFPPEGIGDRPEWMRYNVIPGTPHMGLIAKVGVDGDPFFVGRSFTGSAPGQGRLYLGINDTDLTNNHGSFEVSIILQE